MGNLHGKNLSYRISGIAVTAEPVASLQGMLSSLQIFRGFVPSVLSDSQNREPMRPERRKVPRPEPRKSGLRTDAAVKTILIVDDQAGERKVIRAAVEGFTSYT